MDKKNTIEKMVLAKAQEKQNIIESHTVILEVIMSKSYIIMRDGFVLEHVFDETEKEKA